MIQARMLLLNSLWLFCVVLCLTSGASTLAVSPEARKEFAPQGKLRAAINYGNPALATKDSTTGELRGVAVELSRELGRRLDVPVELIGYDTVAKLVAGLQVAAWDVAFLAIDPTRAGDVAFSAPYMEVENTYLVADKSPIHMAPEVDQPGRRVAVQAKNAADLFLSRELQHAVVVRAANETAAFELVQSGAADALASSRQRLLALAEQRAGYRVVAGRFSAIQHAIGVPKAREAAATYLRGFIEDVKAVGFVKRTIDAAGIRGVVVAPLASNN